MSLSRRQFFRRLVKPGQKTRAEREHRYDEMTAYVRTYLLPYDFGLTAAQEAELFTVIRDILEQTADEELFSTTVRYKIEGLANSKINAWRDAIQLNDQLNRLNEIRQSAVDYVSTFLNGQATPVAVEQLKSRCGIQDPQSLDAELRSRIQDWIATVEDSELLRYDVVTVKDLVFAQLRSWC